MTNIKVFNSPEFGEVRTTIQDGEIAFVAKDVLERLGYADLSNINTIIKHIPDEWKGRNPIPTPSGTQKMWVFTEQGLYFFLARSDKPRALPFQKWIAGDVVPSIRKTGKYSLSTSCQIESLRTRLLLAEQKLQLFEEYNEDILYDFDQVAAAMKIYRKPPFGASHLKRWLAERKILCSAHYKNDKPIQRYIDLDWFRLVMHEWKRRGQRRYEPRFLITQRGFNAIIDMAIRERVITLPIPKTDCLPYVDEPLAPEAGGRIFINDPYGNEELSVEMATAPIPVGEGRDGV
jgi:prophage antirepressor-like protein